MISFSDMQLGKNIHLKLSTICQRKFEEFALREFSMLIANLLAISFLLIITYRLQQVKMASD